MSEGDLENLLFANAAAAILAMPERDEVEKIRGTVRK